MSTAGVLLAAGLSTRMGSPKALLDWRGEPLVVYQVKQMAAAGVDPVVVVLGHQAGTITPHLAGLPVRTVYNPDFASGRASSVRAGAAAVAPDVGGVLFLNVDQPRRVDVLQSLIEAHMQQPHAITVPIFEGRRGHPIVFAGDLLTELQAVTDEGAGLRAVVHRHSERRRELSVVTAAILLDINDPVEYAAAARCWPV